ncbi:MAG TPA: hypothetical protein VFL69_09595 [Marmoricola sp.]|nr:hypothetical protein [Marmoricola sp.]
MRGYTWLWRQLGAVYAVAGLFGGASAIGWASTLVLFACAAAMGFLAALTYAMAEPRPVWSWVWTGMVAGALTIGALGTTCVFGPAGLGVLLLYGLFAPWTLRHVRSLLASPPSMREVARYFDPGAEAQPHREPAPALPTAMTDRELCATWRRSFGQLQRARSAEVKLQVVRLRAECLDELTRRHPREVRAWLASGTRASGDPAPYLESGHSLSD